MWASVVYLGCDDTVQFNFTLCSEQGLRLCDSLLGTEIVTAEQRGF